jgi:hypothetical protein
MEGWGKYETKRKHTYVLTYNKDIMYTRCKQYFILPVCINFICMSMREIIRTVDKMRLEHRGR